MTCDDCGHPIPRGATIWHEVKGWEQDRGAIGGTNHVKDRRRTGRVKCHACVVKGNPGQGALL